MTTRERKPSSVFGAVSTLIMTAGLVFPTLAFTLGLSLPYFLPIKPHNQLLATLCFLTIGYIGGTFHSFGYIRKNLIVRNPKRCTLPSIVGFALFIAGGAGVTIKTLGGDTTGVAIVLIFNSLIVILFSVIAAKGFSVMAREAESRGESGLDF